VETNSTVQTAYEQLMNDQSLTVDYRPSPVVTVWRDCCDPQPNNTGNEELMQDAIAAWWFPRHASEQPN
jgi:hypothetical protein